MSFLTETSETILKDCGWSATRNICSEKWISLLEAAEYPVFEALLDILSNFGGLEIDTISFQKSPFLINETQKVILSNRADPIIEFLPERSGAITLSQARIWKSLDYLAKKKLAIAPIGVFRHVHSRAYSLFVLSDGTIYAGGWYATTDDNRTPGLFYLGSDIEDAINNTLDEFLIFW